jgi:hypothetical protein
MQFGGIAQYPTNDCGVTYPEPRSAIISSRSRSVRQYRKYHLTQSGPENDGRRVFGIVARHIKTALLRLRQIWFANLFFCH